MAEMISVLLFNEIHHGENGKSYRFTPSENELDLRSIPVSVYNEIKDRVPPIVSLAKGQTVTGAEDVTKQEIYSELLTDKDSDKTDDAPILATEFVEYDANDEEEEPATIIAPPLDTLTIAAGQGEPEIGGASETIEALCTIKYVSKPIAAKLVDAQISTIGDVAYSLRDDLLAVTGITQYNVDKILESAKELVGA